MSRISYWASIRIFYCFLGFGFEFDLDLDLAWFGLGLIWLGFGFGLLDCYWDCYAYLDYHGLLGLLRLPLGLLGLLGLLLGLPGLREPALRPLGLLGLPAKSPSSTGWWTCDEARWSILYSIMHFITLVALVALVAFPRELLRIPLGAS